MTLRDYRQTPMHIDPDSDRSLAGSQCQVAFSVGPSPIQVLQRLPPNEHPDVIHILAELL